MLLSCDFVAPVKISLRQATEPCGVFVLSGSTGPDVNRSRDSSICEVLGRTRPRVEPGGAGAGAACRPPCDDLLITDQRK